MSRLAMMFIKLFIVILALGAVACSLLVIRQQRIEAAHEMSVIHQRLEDNQRTLLRMRSEIAAACRPGHVRLLVKHHGGSWIAIPSPHRAAPPTAPAAQRLAEATDASASAPDRTTTNHSDT